MNAVGKAVLEILFQFQGRVVDDLHSQGERESYIAHLHSRLECIVNLAIRGALAPKTVLLYDAQNGLDGICLHRVAMSEKRLRERLSNFVHVVDQNVATQKQTARRIHAEDSSLDKVLQNDFCIASLSKIVLFHSAER